VRHSVALFADNLPSYIFIGLLSALYLSYLLAALSNCSDRKHAPWAGVFGKWLGLGVSAIHEGRGNGSLLVYYVCVLKIGWIRLDASAQCKSFHFLSHYQTSIGRHGNSHIAKTQVPSTGKHSSLIKRIDFRHEMSTQTCEGLSLWHDGS
jgi:hypothetical protein